MDVSIALILMVAALGVGALVVLTVIACDVRRGVGIWSEILRAIDGRAPGEPVPVAPQYAPLRPGECADAARAYHARVTREQDSAALTGQVDPAWGKHRPVEVTPSSEDTLPSVLPQELLDDVRARWEASQKLPPYQETPALGEDEVDTQTWAPGKSGMWERNEKR